MMNGNAAVEHLGAYERALEQAQQFVWLLHGQNKAMVQLTQLDSGKMKYYRSYRGETLPTVLQDSAEYSWLEQDDVYIALNVFKGVRRRETDLVGFNALYTDLDFYKIGISKQDARAEIQRMIDSGEVIEPSIIIDSGRGYQLIWLMQFMANTAAYQKLWRRMQGAIYERFIHLNADNAARSVTQIYRLVGSWSSRTGSLITFEHLADRYTIGELKDALLDDIDDIEPTQQPTRPRKVRRKRAFKESGFSPYTLAKARKDDLEQLVTLRGGYVNRRRLVFYYAVLSLEVFRGDTDTLEKALKRINSRLHKPLPQYVLDSARASAVNSWSVKQGNKHMGYKFTNAYLVENLEITDDEQQYMVQLIGQAEKNRRKRIANEKLRREAGMRTALEYNQERLDKTAQQLEILNEMLAENPKVKRKEIAERLGVSIERVKKLKAQLQQQLKS